MASAGARRERDRANERMHGGPPSEANTKDLTTDGTLVRPQTVPSPKLRLADQITVTGVNRTPRIFRDAEERVHRWAHDDPPAGSERLPWTGTAQWPVPNRSDVRAKSGMRTTLSPTYAGMNGSATASNQPSHPTRRARRFRPGATAHEAARRRDHRRHRVVDEQLAPWESMALHVDDVAEPQPVQTPSPPSPRRASRGRARRHRWSRRARSSEFPSR